MASFETLYISAGTNQTSNALVTFEAEQAFAVASDSEIVYTRFEADLLHSKRIVAPRRHSLPIKCLKRCKRRNTSTEHFVTGGADGRVVLWRKASDSSLVPIFSTPKSASVIGVVGGIVNETKNIKVFSSSVAGSSTQILIYYLIANEEGNQAETKDEQSVELPGKAFALSVDFSTINDCELLAIGSSNRSIELFAFDRKHFHHRLSIPAHSDWVDSLAFKDFSSHLLLASSSQDRSIKLWKIQRETPTEDDDELTVTKNHFAAIDSQGNEFRLCLHVEAVLNGHDDWIHSVSWDSTGKRLVSASSDKTVIVWEENEEMEGLWTDTVRMGIVGGQAAGFYAADFSQDGQMIFASTYYGGVHAWRRNEEDHFQWDALTVPGNGHPSLVSDLSWEPTNGEYLVTVGSDQTTRVHAKMKNLDTWIEIARPQVHGHDMHCVVTVDPARFVSGAEEKIFRAFNAPETFVDTLETLTGTDKKKLFSRCQLAGYGARVPALGLSNKAIEGQSEENAEDEREGNGETHWEEAAFVANPMTLNDAPTEDILMQNTLWPEVHKLYGHGYEVYAVAVSPNGKLLATACKASHPDHAAILIWSTDDWTQRGQAKDGHQLTVTQIEWSPDGKALLSVSRDRTAIIYKEDEGKVDGYLWRAVWRSKNEHSRIIWTCAWMGDSTHFLTGSRDQRLILWRFDGEQAVAELATKLSQPITAVGVSRHREIEKASIITGLQDGRVLMFRFNVETKQFLQCGEIGGDRVSGIESPVTRIRFRPNVTNVNAEEPIFAISGSDFKARIFRILA
ncbi:unnamed protein product, partial [Mesorhabditis belari]|uniref:Elongator complex protein 2 n=1 Tax=Mesorhabditis belari TaxID=2138241 RepID=A0AAF3J2F6_9BILA